MSDQPGYIALGPCLLCGRSFAYNPALVPSVYVDRRTNVPPDVGGTSIRDAVRKPLCPSCVVEVNEERERAGTGAIAVLPGAYEPAQGLPD